MRIYTALLIALFAIFVGACGTATVTKKDDAKSDATKTEKKDTPKKETTSKLSPTDTIKAFISAYQKKDVAAMKKVLTQKSLDEMEKAAKAAGTTLDKKLEEFVNGETLPFKGEPEIRNEKIEGDKANVDVKVDGKWEKTPLVKENGAWKFSFEN